MFYTFLLSRALYASSGFPAPKFALFLKVRKSLLFIFLLKISHFVKSGLAATEDEMGDEKGLSEGFAGTKKLPEADAPGSLIISIT